jgi:phosphatidylglycerol---prolipoprotein diacylglyceryl transferase
MLASDLFFGGVMRGFIWNGDPVMVAFGPVEIRWYSFFFLLTGVIGFLAFERHLKKRGYKNHSTELFFLIGMILSLVTARIAHCLLYDLHYYSANPLKILKIWEGGIASHGAAAGMLITAVAYSKIKKIPLLIICDAGSFLTAIAAFFVRLGNFFNSEVVGRATDLPIGVKFIKYSDGGEFYRHPSQLYESFSAIIILVIITVISLKQKNLRDGFILGVFTAGYNLTRFFIEFLKEYQSEIVVKSSPLTLTMGQQLSLPLALLGIYLAIRFRPREIQQHRQ